MAESFSHGRTISLQWIDLYSLALWVCVHVHATYMQLYPITGHTRNTDLSCQRRRIHLAAPN